MGDVWTIDRRGPLTGALTVPGDKSISHRALMFNALAGADGVELSGLLRSEDVLATAGALRAWGVEVRGLDQPGPVRVFAPERFRPADRALDCGNSGTSMRLLAGIAARQPFRTVLTGDDSLCRRPMKRVTVPLGQMGARIETADGRPPLAIDGGVLQSIGYDSPLASAQVKSCVLLAGMDCGVRVREPRQSRDHTERFLRRMGAQLQRDADGWLQLAADTTLAAMPIEVPGDMSAAAFWLVAGCIVPSSRLVLRRVGTNPTRSGVVDALRKMGADIHEEPIPTDGPEPMAHLHVGHAELTGTRIDGELALRALDELPVLAVAAAHAHGETVIADAQELRVKESDRISRVVAGLRAIGASVEEQPDGMVIEGSGGRALTPRPDAVVDAHGDHRIAMAFTVGALVSGPVRIAGAESVRSSYPAFREHLEHLCP